MNPSFSILQKLKNQYLQIAPNNSAYHVAFAPFAFSLTNEDFFFLKTETDLTTGSDAKKYDYEQAEFSHIANSVLKTPHIWALNSDGLLYEIYKNILENAAFIDPDFLTFEEQAKINEATVKLYNSDGSDSAKYQMYKKYMNDYSNLEGETEKTQVMAEWYTKGFKNFIETALKTIKIIYQYKTDFLDNKWVDARISKLPASLKTLVDNEEFYITSCIPNGICDSQAPIWKKILLSKQEILTLSDTFTKELPNDVISAFGNIEMQLDSIEFEYCLLDIIRPWFDESVINNSYWKFREDNRILSEGNDSMKGEIPAYPIKLILAKNIDLVFTPNNSQNEEIKNKLINGDRVFFGPLLLKTIPLNLAKNKINTFRIQQLSTNQLSIITKVAIQNTTVIPKINETSKFKLLKLLNRQPQAIMKKNVEMKSININKSKTSPLGTSPVRSTIIAPGTGKGITPLRSGVFRNDILTHVAAPVPKPPSVTQPNLPSNSTITGKIIDESNQPLEFVELQLMKTDNASTQSVLSNADGTYNFANIENGFYQFTVRKTNYNTIENKIDINGNTNLDFKLTHQPLPIESLQLLGVICKKLPKLPNPLNGANYF